MCQFLDLHMGVAVIHQVRGDSIPVPCSHHPHLFVYRVDSESGSNMSLDATVFRLDVIGL